MHKLAFVSLLALAACQQPLPNQQNDQTRTGALIGAGVGAAVGAAGAAQAQDACRYWPQQQQAANQPGKYRTAAAVGGLCRPRSFDGEGFGDWCG